MILGLQQQMQEEGTPVSLSAGSTFTVGESPRRSARVYTSHTTPARASAVASSRTYTFMPPPSPVPGCASGDVCIDRTTTFMQAMRTTGMGGLFPPWR